MTLLAVSIAVADTPSALDALARAAAVAQVAELRLDLMQEFDLERLITRRPLSVIVTCRPQREGGRWQGEETQRLALLRRAAALGADYVDLEWDRAGEIDTFDRSHTRIILSGHDFVAMPTDLTSAAAQLREQGADVVKLVGLAHQLADIVPVLDLLAAAPGPTIAIAMGAAGLPTRLLAFRYPQALLSFATLDTNSRQTAPGQITAAEMLNSYRVEQLRSATPLVGWLSPDVNRSAEAAQANGWLAQQGIDGMVVPFQPAEAELVEPTLNQLAQRLPLRGCLAPVSGATLRSWTPGRGWQTAGDDLFAALQALLN